VLEQAEAVVEVVPLVVAVVQEEEAVAEAQ
jgi:hypothetical protein